MSIPLLHLFIMPCAITLDEVGGNFTILCILVNFKKICLSYYMKLCLAIC
jgi:hypothetical protein